MYKPTTQLYLKTTNPLHRVFKETDLQHKNNPAPRDGFKFLPAGICMNKDHPGLSNNSITFIWICSSCNSRKDSTYHHPAEWAWNGHGDIYNRVSYLHCKQGSYVHGWIVRGWFVLHIGLKSGI